MTQNTAELEQFLRWFSSQDTIPLQVRRDFFAHVKEVGGIDEKAAQFLDETLSKLEARDAKIAAVLKEKTDLFDAAMTVQKSPQGSITGRIVENITSWFNSLVQDFKDQVNTAELAESKVEENAENKQEADEIARIKASLV